MVESAQLLADLTDTEREGVQNYGKLADAILEHLVILLVVSI